MKMHALLQLGNEWHREKQRMKHRYPWFSDSLLQSFSQYPVGYPNLQVHTGTSFIHGADLEYGRTLDEQQM